MKYYGLNKGKYIKRVRYQIERSRIFALQYLSRSQSRREHYKYLYTNHLSTPRISHKPEVAIPNGKVCRPIGVVTSDLVLKEELTTLKNGLVHLIRTCHTHKYRGTMPAIEELLEDLDKMDNLHKWSYSSIYAGTFDFERHQTLRQYVAGFFLHIRQVNSSYLAMEARLIFTDEYSEKLQNIIGSDIDKQETYLAPALSRNRKKSGAKKGVAYGITNSSSRKGDVIYDEIKKVKWEFYSFINQYIPTFIHRLRVAPPSVLFYETNIDYRETDLMPFWASIGLGSWCGQFIDDARKFFFQTGQGFFGDRNKTDNMVYIYHVDKISLEGGFRHIEDQEMYCYISEYSSEVFKYQFLEILNREYADKLISYSMKCNKIKLKRSQLYKLLKLRYYFGKRQIYSHLPHTSTPHDNRESLHTVSESQRDCPASIRIVATSH